MSHDPVEDLRNEIVAGRALAIVGAGVSIGATQGNPVASWTGLLLDGVKRCVAVAQPLPDGWEGRVRAEIRSGDLDDLLSAAEKISRKLGAPDGGEYSQWLEESVGALRVKDPSLIEALRDLKIPLATTNYDGLLEEVIGLPAVTWQAEARVQKAIRGDKPAILHLHGYWEEPETVVLGIRSYERVIGDTRAQNVLRTLQTVSTLLLVGCGEGLTDPNFGALRDWAKEVFRKSPYPHYRLCKDPELNEVRRVHQGERIRVLSYGPDHTNLTAFLYSLRSRSSSLIKARSRRPEYSTLTRVLPPPPQPPCFGREAELQTLVQATCADLPPPVLVLGGPGVGKTTVTLAALHHSGVIEHFGNRRCFVRCEGANSQGALVGEIGLVLQLEPGIDLESRIFRELGREPTLLVLDNAETPWNGDRLGAEELFAELAAVPGLALVASIRESGHPLGPIWREVIRVAPLSLSAARDVFLTIAGERYQNDPDLDWLLEAMDCLPLAVTLLAYQAESEPNLAGLRQRWTEARTRLLQSEGAGHE